MEWKFIFHYCSSLTLSRTTNFRLVQTDNNFKFNENGRKFSIWVQNTVGKGEIAPFPTMFSKDLYGRNVKTRACLGKG